MIERVGGYLPSLIAGAGLTLKLTISAMLLASVLGLALAVVRFVRTPFVAWLVPAYVTVVRNTPELVQLYLFFYALPAWGINVGAFQTATLVLGLHFAASLAEVYRGGIASIDQGQWEAAIVLGLPKRKQWTRIILPQVFRRIIPAWGNYVTVMVKVTALTSVITVPELTLVGNDIAARNFRFLEVFTLVGIIYFLINFPLSLIVRHAERRLARSEVTGKAGR